MQTPAASHVSSTANIRPLQIASPYFALDHQKSDASPGEPAADLNDSDVMSKVDKLLAVFEAASEDLRQNSNYLLSGGTLSFFQN
jgi:hypothetical protein